MANVPVSDLPQGLKNQLCVSYAVLLLNDSQQDISVDNLTKVLNAANVKVDASYLRTFADALEGQNVSNFFACGGGASSAGAAGEQQ